MKLGKVLCQENQLEEGIVDLRQVSPMSEFYVASQLSAVDALLGLNRRDEAIACCEAMLPMPRARRDAAIKLGYLYYMSRQSAKAYDYWKISVETDSKALSALTMTAWMLATDPDPNIRNGTEAMRLALQAAELSNRQSPPVLAALAAAYSETGDFAEASETLILAHELAAKQSNARIVQLAEALLPFYQSGKKYEDRAGILLMSPGDIR